MTSVSQIGCELGIVRATTATIRETRTGAVLAATSVGACLVFANGAIINVALAGIARDLNLDAHALQWILNAELLPLAALTLVAGALGDRFGQKQVFFSGLILFSAASLGCAAAQDSTLLVCARFAQGTGEALIMPTSLTVLGQAFPPARKSWAVGVWSACGAIAGAVAPALAGLLLHQGSWRAVFLMQLPLAGVAIVLATIWVPKGPRDPNAEIDLGAAGLSVVGLGGLGWSLMSLTNGHAVSPALSVVAVVTIVAIAALVAVEWRKGNKAMLPPSLFAGRTIIALNLFTLLLYGAFNAVLTLLPFVMIRASHLSVVLAGVAFIPLQIVIAAISPLAGVLCARFGHSVPLAVGALITGLGCAAALKIGASAEYWADVFPSVALVAVGMSIVIAPMTTLVLTSVDASRAATASGFNGAVSRAGALLAIALLGGILQRSGSDLIHGFHVAMLMSSLACVTAALAAFSIPVTPDPDPVFGL